MELLDRLPIWRAPPDQELEPGPPPEARGREPIPMTRLTDHVVLIGHGRVGSVVSQALREAKLPFLVIESDQDASTELRKQAIQTITGNAADPEVLRAANLVAARFLLVAIPDAFEGGQAVMQARAINPYLLIIARAHSEEEVAHLNRLGATTVIMGELEIAKAMIEDVRKTVMVQGQRPDALAPSLAEEGTTA
jgi:CPA2 family monovalent cation:H+ antiporter-2